MMHDPDGAPSQITQHKPPQCSSVLKVCNVCLHLCTSDYCRRAELQRASVDRNGCPVAPEYNFSKRNVGALVMGLERVPLRNAEIDVHANPYNGVEGLSEKHATLGKFCEGVGQRR